MRLFTLLDKVEQIALTLMGKSTEILTPEDALANLGGMGWELIWENANLNSSFGDTTLNGFDLSDCEMIAITHFGQFNAPESPSGIYGYKTDFIPVHTVGTLQSTTMISSSYVPFINSRAVSVDRDGTIRFDNAYSVYGANIEKNSNQCRPFRIYKLKNVPSTVK